MNRFKIDLFQERRRYFLCGKLGHIAANCPNADTNERHDSDYTLAISDMVDDSTEVWILDSGSSRHLVGNMDWLDDCKDASGICVQPDGKPLNITKRGSVV